MSSEVAKAKLPPPTVSIGQTIASIFKLSSATFINYSLSLSFIYQGFVAPHVKGDPAANSAAMAVSITYLTVISVFSGSPLFGGGFLMSGFRGEHTAYQEILQAAVERITPLLENNDIDGVRSALATLKENLKAKLQQVLASLQQPESSLQYSYQAPEQPAEAQALQALERFLKTQPDDPEEAQASLSSAALEAAFSLIIKKVETLRDEAAQGFARVYRNCLIFGMSLVPVSIGLMVFSEDILKLMHQEPAIAELAGGVLKVESIGMGFLAAQLAAQQVLVGPLQAHPLILFTAVGGLGLGLTYALVASFGKIPVLEEIGLENLAIAQNITVISTGVGYTLFLALHPKQVFPIISRLCAPFTAHDKELFKLLLRIGGSVAGVFGTAVAGAFIQNALAGKNGLDAAQAYAIGTNGVDVFLTPWVLSLCAALGSMASEAWGEGKLGDFLRIVNCGLVTSLVVVSPWIVLSLSDPDVLTRWMSNGTASEEVIELARPVTRVIAVAALANVLETLWLTILRSLHIPGRATMIALVTTWLGWAASAGLELVLGDMGIALGNLAGFGIALPLMGVMVYKNLTPSALLSLLETQKSPASEQPPEAVQPSESQTPRCRWFDLRWWFCRKSQAPAEAVDVGVELPLLLGAREKPPERGWYNCWGCFGRRGPGKVRNDDGASLGNINPNR